MKTTSIWEIQQLLYELSRVYTRQHVARQQSESKCLTSNQKPTGSQFSLIHEPATCCLLPATCCLISATCIPLYTATDEQQIGNNVVADNNFVAGNKQHVEGNMLPGVNAALGFLELYKLTFYNILH